MLKITPVSFVDFKLKNVVHAYVDDCAVFDIIPAVCSAVRYEPHAAGISASNAGLADFADIFTWLVFVLMQHISIRASNLAALRLGLLTRVFVV